MPALQLSNPDARPALEALIERIDRDPMDSVACFQLAFELFKSGGEQDGVRFLGRAIRIEPGLILPLLHDPSHAPMREHVEVKRLLWTAKRNFERRLLTSYA